MKVLKIVGVVFGLLVGVVLLAWFGYGIYQDYQGDKWERKAAEFKEELEKPYKNDTYGGKTPEETWGMFLDALKKGDAELASKYFAVGKQEEWKKIVEDTIKNGKLPLVISNLSGKFVKDVNLSSGSNVYYNLQIIKGRDVKYNSVVFYLNSITNVWKILIL